MYLHLTRSLEPVAVIAARAGMSEDDASRILVKMTGKGHTFPKAKGGLAYYAAAPFMHGFFEHYLSLDPDKEIVGLIDSYINSGFIPRGRALRTVPVQAGLSGEKVILPFDDVRTIVEGKERIGLMPCACATKGAVLGKGCAKPVEVCLAFDYYAEYPIEHFGVGRWIGRKEALGVLERARDAGLVHQPGGDRRNVECICNCCSDCCVSLRLIKAFPQPSKIVLSNYRATYSPEDCSGCGACLGRCPMGAFAEKDSVISFNGDRCIGCGLCVSACPSGACILERKQESELRQPPSPEKYSFMKSSLDYDEDVLRNERSGGGL
jgi:Fe-S-cluster-containing hydrogenase component 2